MLTRSRSKLAGSPIIHIPFTKLSQSTPIGKSKRTSTKSTPQHYPIVTRRNAVVKLLTNVRTRSQKQNAKSFLEQTHFNPNLVSNIIDQSPLLNDLKPLDGTPTKHHKKKKKQLKSSVNNLNISATEAGAKEGDTTEKTTEEKGNLETVNTEDKREKMETEE